jgi:hypothetical protein
MRAKNFATFGQRSNPPFFDPEAAAMTIALDYNYTNILVDKLCYAKTFFSLMKRQQGNHKNV